MEPTETNQGTIPRKGLIGMILVAGGLTLAAVTGLSIGWVLTIITLLVEGGAAAAIVVAAGGFGGLVLRKLAPQDAPAGLRGVTACALGLWMLSTVVLIIGSLTHGLMTGWFWWPVIGVGLVLAFVQIRRRLENLQRPARFDSRSLLWVAIAIAVALAAAGATRPVGAWIGVGEEYDVMEYHLEVPREFHDAQHISQLPHNTYSYYPLGVEMLYLLAMNLRGGPWNGMYLAKMLHAAFGVLAVAGIFSALNPTERFRARFSAGLLATVPFVIFLTWIAVSELAELCYAALALLWLREWIVRRTSKSAVCIGLMLGAACAMKYLSVGLIALPILAVAMVLVWRNDRLRRLGDVVLMGLLALVLFSPWLVRNYTYTANPVFPLATETFGRGPHWTAEVQQRWIDGHSPQVKPPVPVPPDYQYVQGPSDELLFFNNFINFQPFGQIFLLLGGVGICLLIADPRRSGAWNWSLAGVLALQVGIWAAFSHEMPPRFLTPALATIALLGGWALARLTTVQVNPFRRAAAQEGQRHWGLMPAVTIFCVTAGINLLTGYAMYEQYTLSQEGRLPPLHGVPGDTLAKKVPLWNFANNLHAGSRLMLVGDATPYYFPAGTIYATTFNVQPLATIARKDLSPEQSLEKLHTMGVTHILVNWAEMLRLANTYGFPAELTNEMFQRLKAGRLPAIAILEKLKPLGLREISTDLGQFHPAARRWRGKGSPETVWPIATLYALPWAPRAETQPTSTPSASSSGQ